MRDKLTARIDDVGEALVADLDPGHDVPDELEVDLRHRHPGAFARAGHRDGHVGLGILAKMHRAEIGLAGLCDCEARIGGKVGAPASDVHSHPRHVQLLAAGEIEHAHLGDGRHQAQQFQVLDAALFQAGRADLRQAHPAELALDFQHVGLDARGRGLGLFLLQVEQRRLALLVGEIGADRAAGDQRGANERDEVDRVLAEQRTAGDHLITLSARSSTDCGMAMPSILAVLRLITSSKIVGCSIGRSPGLAPLRILSTYVAERR